MICGYANAVIIAVVQLKQGYFTLGVNLGIQVGVVDNQYVFFLEEQGGTNSRSREVQFVVSNVGTVSCTEDQQT